MEWQPIETAPKDKSVLVFRPTLWRGRGHVGVAEWNDDRHAKRPRPFWQSTERWISVTENRSHLPTHWMPLPPAPEGE